MNGIPRELEKSFAMHNENDSPVILYQSDEAGVRRKEMILDSFDADLLDTKPMHWQSYKSSGQSNITQ